MFDYHHRKQICRPCSYMKLNPYLFQLNWCTVVVMFMNGNVLGFQQTETSQVSYRPEKQYRTQLFTGENKYKSLGKDCIAIYQLVWMNYDTNLKNVFTLWYNQFQNPEYFSKREESRVQKNSLKAPKWESFHQNCKSVRWMLEPSRFHPLTYLVCVAEKRRVCLSAGRWSKMASIVLWNPRSRMRSASSRTSSKEKEERHQFWWQIYRN